MTLAVSHNFVSPIVDQADPNLLGPDEWNDDHATSMATNKLLGRATAGAGTIEEITLGSNLSFTGTTLNAAGAPGGANTQVQYNNSSAFGGDASFTYGGNGAVTIGTSGHTGSVAFKGTTSGTVTVKPLDTAGTWTFKWPNSAGTNGYVLQTDGSGNTSWVLQTGSTGSLTIGTTTISGGTDKHVVYDNAGVVGEAANFTIESGNPNVTAGNVYLYDGSQVIQAQIALNNFYEGGAGNLTGTGADNLGTGPNALAGVTTGHNNVAVGSAALQFMDTGSENFAFGAFALQSTSSGTQNVGVGTNVLFHNTTGSFNVGIGRQALNGNIDGTGHIAIGQAALNASQHDNTNIALGSSTLVGLNGGSGNVAIGAVAGFSMSTGNNNSLIGNNCAQGITTGSANTVLGGWNGSGSGVTITTGDRNIVIGVDCDISNATASGQLSIGNYIYGTGLTGTGSTISTGKIGIGIKAPNFNFDVAGSLGCAEATAILHNSTTVTGGATGNVPTLTAGPVTGNPTKWLPYDDNGTTRYIPSW